MSDARCRMMITALTASIVLVGCSSSDTKGSGRRGASGSHAHNGPIAYERFAGARDEQANGHRSGCASPTAEAAN